MDKEVLFTNDAVVAGILFFILLAVFKAARYPYPILQKFFTFFPPILLCYFLPGLLNTLGVFSGENSQVYPFVSKYLLPATLFLFTISLDIDMLKKLGWKALVVFLSGTLGVIIGGPLAVKIVYMIKPEVFMMGTENEVWKGLGTIAGSWIGGGANQTALKEILQPSAYVFSQTVAVDVLVAEAWLAVLLIGVANAPKVNKWLNADASIVEDMKSKVAELAKQNDKIPSYYDFLKIFGISMVFVGISYFLADLVTPWVKTNHPEWSKFSLTSTFFWVVFLITVFGIVSSRTKVKELEYAGASKIASLMLYLLVASIGMQMDLLAIADNLWLFLVGIVVLASKLLKAPYFMLAVGSQANIGGAASASVVAGAFHPTLVPIGVIFAVLGYAIGTYGGYLTALLMHWVLS